MEKLTPRQIIDNIQQAGNLFPEGYGLKSEIHREGDRLIAIPILEGGRMPMYFSFHAKYRKVRLRKTAYLPFLPKGIDVKQVDSYCRSRIYFYCWMLRTNSIITQFVPWLGLKVKEDRLGNIVMAFTAFSDADTWEKFCGDWSKFYGELSNLSVMLMRELHKHICSVVVDNLDGSHVPFNLGNEKVQA